MSELDTMLDELAEAMKPLVAAIEAKPATTKGHYGEYLLAIPKIIERFHTGPMPKALPLAVGVALQRAGANKDGVQSALRILGHL